MWMPERIKLRLKGSALAYSIMVVMLLSVLMSAMVMTGAVNRHVNDVIYSQELAMDNLESGLNLLFYQKNAGYQRLEKSLFQSEIDHFEGEVKEWGMLGAWWGRGMHGQHAVYQEGLAGIRAEGVKKGGLFLAKNRAPLSLAGDTRLEGIVYLENSRLRPGDISRKPYRNSRLVFGEIRDGKNRAPELSFDTQKQLKERLSDCYAGNFSGGWLPVAGDSLYQSFRNPLQIFSASTSIFLSDIQASGNLIFIAPEIQIGKAAALENVLLFAQRVFIEEGFRGTLQVFASDTLETGQSVRLDYPSVLAVGNPEGAGTLILGEKTQIEGFVANTGALCGNLGGKEGMTFLEPNVHITGELLAPENCFFQGRMDGFFYTTELVAKTPTGVYHNHLLDAQISSKRRSGNFVGAIWGKVPERFDLISRKEPEFFNGEEEAE